MRGTLLSGWVQLRARARRASRRIRSTTTILVAGWAMLAVGVGLLLPAAGLIVGGATLIAGVLFGERGAR